MRLLRLIFRATGQNRIFLVKALILVVSIRLALFVVPFRKLQSWVKNRRVPQMTPKILDEITVQRVVWAVKSASQPIPRATCLTQALVAHIMLGRRGRDSELKFGVARNPAGQFEAHAWVEVGGKVVIGDNEDVTRFSPLTTIEKFKA